MPKQKGQQTHNEARLHPEGPGENKKENFMPKHKGPQTHDETKLLPEGSGEYNRENSTENNAACAPLLGSVQASAQIGNPRFSQIFFYSGEDEQLGYRLNNFPQLQEDSLRHAAQIVQECITRVNPYACLLYTSPSPRDS